MSSFPLVSSCVRSPRGEVVVISTIEFDPPYNDGLPYAYSGETAFFVGEEQRFAGRIAYRWPETAVARHEAVCVRARGGRSGLGR